ncbi:MAG: hypothetical protein ACFFBZ_16330 [Promethearchaeota archaeon]
MFIEDSKGIYPMGPTGVGYGEGRPAGHPYRGIHPLHRARLSRGHR